MLRLGLCCKFIQQPIKFRMATAANLSHYAEKGNNPHAFLSELILDNVKALHQALSWCVDQEIGSFRVGSSLFALYTHPQFHYTLEDLPDGEEIKKQLNLCKTLASDTDMRLVLHPDQFVVLNALDSQIVKNSIQELEYQNTLADFVGADVINIHGGGVYGDKISSLKRLETNLKQLSKGVLEKLTLENDEKCFTPHDLIPLCLKVGIPFVYDVHHHHCLADGLGIEEATMQAIETWDREPLFHVSSPKNGWSGLNPEQHHDYIDIRDFPASWRSIGDATIEVEAKGKELAVLKLQKELAAEGIELWKPKNLRV